MTAIPQPTPPILAWTDGSARPTNPGFGGWAFLIDHKSANTVHMQFGWLGFGATNNYAELIAITRCLDTALGFLGSHTPLVILTDSQWAQRCIHGEYKAKKHVTLISSIRKKMDRLGDCSIRWVKGHAGKSWNEAVDRMANLATYDSSIHAEQIFDREDFFPQAEEFLKNYERIRDRS